MVRLECIVFATIANVCMSLPARCADVAVHVETAAGAVIESAIVYAVPTIPAHAEAGARYVIDQVNRRFVPHISVVQSGTSVEFPNSDNIRHSVYSFSPARIFNLKLYAGKAADPVVFEKSGLVVLGCNIHDSMVAWLLVVDTPYFARTDRAGLAMLPRLPAGEYTLHAWHAPMTEDEQVSESLRVEDGAKAASRTLRISVPLEPPEPVANPK